MEIIMVTEILDLIKRDDVLALIIKDINNDEIPSSVQEYLFNLRRKIWDIEPQVKYGKWVYNPDGMDWNLGCWQCGECHCNNNNFSTDEKINPMNWAGSKFCPNCGARMIGYERLKRRYE